MQILAFLVVWEKKVGRSFALCDRAPNTLVPEYREQTFDIPCAAGGVRFPCPAHPRHCANLEKAV